MGVPGSDDVMLAYQSTSFHDAASVRELVGLRPAPEFLGRLQQHGLWVDGRLAPPPAPLLTAMTAALEGTRARRLTT